MFAVLTFAWVKIAFQPSSAEVAMKLLAQAWEKLMKWIDGDEVLNSNMTPQQVADLCESGFEAWD